MEKIYSEVVGVDDLYYARILQDNEGLYLTDEPYYLAPVAEIGIVAEVNRVETYYNDKMGNYFVTEGKTDINIDVSNLTPELVAYLCGKYMDTLTGRVFDSGRIDSPDFALGFRFNLGNYGYRYYWYMKGKFSVGSEEAVGKRGDVEVKNFRITFTAVPTDFNWVIEGVRKPLKRVFKDSFNPAFDPLDWFDAVQTATIVHHTPFCGDHVVCGVNVIV